MKNFEKFEKEIREIGMCSLAVKDGKPVNCNELKCNGCLFKNTINCEQSGLNWLYEEYKEPTIDWSKVPIDAKIIITMPNGNKMRRHFAGVAVDGKPCYFAFGIDSWVNDEAERVVILDDCTVEIVEE